MKVKTLGEILIEVATQFISVGLVVAVVLAVVVLHKLGEVSGAGGAAWLFVVALIVWYGRGR